MKLKKLIDVCNCDVYIGSVYENDNTQVSFIPINNFLCGSSFIMNLSVTNIEIYFEGCALIAWVDLPSEIMPAIIKYNDNFSITLEKEYM